MSTERDTPQIRLLLADDHQLTPDVVLMDVELPVMDGIEATERTVASGGSGKILILTRREDGEDVRRAVRAGARGFQIKNSDRTELIKGIGAVSRGERWISPYPAKSLPPEE